MPDHHPYEPGHEGACAKCGEEADQHLHAFERDSENSDDCANCGHGITDAIHNVETPADAGVVLTPAEFDALPEYSTSLPTGKTIGKRWKRRDKDSWVMGTYVKSADPNYVGIVWSPITVTGGDHGVEGQERSPDSAKAPSTPGGTGDDAAVKALADPTAQALSDAREQIAELQAAASAANTGRVAAAEEYRAQIAGLSARVAELERSYVPQDIAIGIIGALEAAGMGKPGKANTAQAMVNEIIAERDKALAALADLQRQYDQHSANCTKWQERDNERHEEQVAGKIDAQTEVERLKADLEQCQAALDQAAAGANKVIDQLKADLAAERERAVARDEVQRQGWNRMLDERNAALADAAQWKGRAEQAETRLQERDQLYLQAKLDAEALKAALAETSHAECEQLKKELVDSRAQVFNAKARATFQQVEALAQARKVSSLINVLDILTKQFAADLAAANERAAELDNARSALPCDPRDQLAAAREAMREHMKEITALKAELEMLKASPGVVAIAQERQRQVSAEGWTPAHDDMHKDGSLASAASCYAEHAVRSDGHRADTVSFHRWPWHPSWWKPKTQLRDLERAGALIAAEIDRLLRAAGKA